MKTYEQALEEINNIEVKSKVIQKFLMSLTIEDLKLFSAKVKERAFLPKIFEEKTHLKSIGIPVLFSLFDEDEIEDYFIQCCLKLHRRRCKNEWIRPSKKDFFLEILGACWIHRFPYKQYIEEFKKFNNYYYNFYKEDIYPNEIIEQAIDNIKKRKTLEEIYSKIISNKHYFGLSITPPMIFEFSVIPRIGTEEMKNYFREIKTKIGLNSEMIAYSTMSTAVFGNNMVMTLNNLKNSKYAFPKLMHSFLSAIFPEMLTSYCGNLNNYLELGDFTTQEKEYWQNYYLKNRNHSRQTYPGSKNLETVEKAFDTQLSQIMNIFYKQRRVPTQTEILKLLKEPPEDSISKDNFSYQASQKIRELKQYLYESQKEFFDYQNDIWKIYFKKKDRIRYNIFDFTLIKSKNLREECKKIIILALKDNIDPNKIKLIINHLSDLENAFKIKSFNEIKLFHLISYYHKLETNEHFNPATLKNINYRFKISFNYLIKLGLSEDNINIAHNIKFYNIESYHKKTKAIPKEILNSLLKVIDEVPTQVNLIFRLLLETGWRFEEIVRLTPGCFKPIEAFPDFIQVSTILYKTASSRKNSGLGEIHTGFITKELYEKIKVFLKETKTERKKFSIETCFYSLRKGFCEHIVPSFFNYNINQLIRKHSIKGSDGKLWPFSSRQLRKTTTVELIDAGIPLTSVQKQLGHLHASTTEKYYAEVNKEHLKDKNNQFFSETVFYDKDKTDNNKEERSLSVLTVSVRKLFGSCLHPFSENLCPKIKEFKCFECPRFYTCLDYKSELSLIQNNLSDISNQLENYYESKNLKREEYSNYEEYKLVKEQLLAVTSIMERINVV